MNEPVAGPEGGEKGVDYRQGSHLWLLLQEMVTEIADRILQRRIEERDNSTVAAPTF